VGPPGSGITDATLAVHRSWPCWPVAALAWRRFSTMAAQPWAPSTPGTIPDFPTEWAEPVLRDDPVERLRHDGWAGAASFRPDNADTVICSNNRANHPGTRRCQLTSMSAISGTTGTPSFPRHRRYQQDQLALPRPQWTNTTAPMLALSAAPATSTMSTFPGSTTGPAPPATPARSAFHNRTDRTNAIGRY